MRNCQSCQRQNRWQFELYWCSLDSSCLSRNRQLDNRFLRYRIDTSAFRHRYFAINSSMESLPEFRGVHLLASLTRLANDFYGYYFRRRCLNFFWRSLLLWGSHSEQYSLGRPTLPSGFGSNGCQAGSCSLTAWGV